MIAVLFAEKYGIYSRIRGVDLWDIERDARTYDGPHPVVAHPPCQRWGSFAFVNYKRWPFEHNRPGNDGGCFASALESVRKYGGVLEHPAKSRAWDVYALDRPNVTGWNQTSAKGEWVCEVWQSAYGHRANKATWLFCKSKEKPMELRWNRPTGTHQVGFHDQRGKDKNKPTLGKKEANSTPLDFAMELIHIARRANFDEVSDLEGLQDKSFMGIL